MKNYLIVVDVQKDFVDGALGTKEAVAIIPRVTQIIAAHRAAGEPVIFTRDTHGENYMQTNEGKHLPVPHCIRDTPGWEIYPGVYDGESVIADKPSFGFLDWETYICEPASILLIGLCTDICVVSNALILKALFPETRVMVAPDACAGVTPATHDAAIATMKMCQVEIM